MEAAEPGDPTFEATIKKGRRSKIMKLHRLRTEPDGKCRSPIVVNSPQIDASQIYGSDEEYLQVRFGSLSAQVLGAGLC